MKSYLKLLVLMMMSSCASYAPRMIKKVKSELSPGESSLLNGTYSMIPLATYNRKGNERESYKNSYHKEFKDLKLTDANFDSLANYKVTLKLLDNKTLRSVLVKDGQKIDSIKITGKFRSSGMFHFKGNNLSCTGIPYILGGCSANKTRIGLTKNGNLLINRAYSSGGAMLLIFGAGSAHNTASSFLKLKSS